MFWIAAATVFLAHFVAGHAAERRRWREAHIMFLSAWVVTGLWALYSAALASGTGAAQYTTLLTALVLPAMAGLGAGAAAAVARRYLRRI